MIGRAVDQVTRPSVRTDEPRLAKYHVPEVVFGPGALAEVGACAARVGARRPFLVTDPGLIEAGWAWKVQRSLTGAGLRPVVWAGVTPNPKDHEVQAAYQRYREAGADVIIGLGGGSCIDAAKGVAILAANGGHILDYAGVDRVSRPIPPLVMVPSTAGTGADVSQFAVITDTARAVKVTIISRTLVPDVSVIDPCLLVTMPDWLTAATGLDALTHAVESYVSRARNPLTEGHSLRATDLVFDHLTHTLVEPRALPPRVAMAQAALEAGMAFTNAILGATHAMSHQVGGLLDLPHGLINGVLLPHVMRFNAAAVPEAFVPLARVVGVDTRGPAGDVAAVLADRVRELADVAGVPRGLAELGVSVDDIPVLAANTLDDACLATNPRPVSRADVEALFRRAL